MKGFLQIFYWFLAFLKKQNCLEFSYTELSGSHLFANLNSRSIIVFLLVFSGISANIYAQSSTESFKKYSIDQGLAQSSVYAIIQDSKGFLWFGTQSGLSKYDGIKFYNYEYDLADTNSISSNWIYALAEDQSGNIWIGTRSGLNKLNPKTGNITRFEHNPNNPNSLPDPKVYCVHIDKAGIVWFLSTSKQTTSKLCKLDPKTGKIFCYEYQVDYFSFYESVSGWPMYEDKNENIWFGSHDGLHVFSKKDEAFAVFRYDEKNPNSLSDNIVTSIVEAKQNILWIGTKNGLNKFNKKTRSFTRFYSKPGDNKSLIGNEIASLFIDHRGFLWVGGAVDGLSMLNPATDTYTNFRTDPKRPTTSLSSNSVFSINEDKSHNLWIGTDGNGLSQIDLKSKKFEIYNSDNGISDNMMSAVFEESKNILWIGTWNNGLNILNRETGEIKLYSDKLNGDKKLIDDHIHAILKDSRGKIWIGTNKGVNIYYPETKKMMNLQDYFKGDVKITSRVNSIIETKNKNIWVGTENGAYYLDFQYHDARGFFNKPNETNSLSSNHVYSILEDSDGEIWITTVTGLNKLNLIPFSVQRFLYDPKNINSPRSNSIYCAIQDKQGLIWLATSCGLNTYDNKTKKFNYFTKKDGLPSDELYGVIEDNNGDIWITTLRGLSVFNKKTGKIHSYDKADGLQSLEFNLGSMHKSPIDGELFMGGVNGLNAFYPNKFKTNNVIPPMVITRITKKSNNGEEIVNFEEGKEIVLTYQDFLVTVEFAALDYTYPEKNSYSYKMTGSGSQNEDWVDIGNRTFVSFSNMNPGDYTITIKGANNDNVWNPKGITIHIIVKPPYWKTIWAFLFYLLTGAIILWYFIASRTKKLKSANQILREKQYQALEIAKQKEDLSRKNKSITDSINYAKRIQEAMMPSEYLFNKLLADAFILYQPKDIVSGDFYWITEKRNKIFIAAVDCTGHGVPGAFMSIIGYDLLKTITKEREIENPAEILNQLNEGVADTFSKNVVDGDVKDGMDIAICVIDKNNQTLEFAGAMNPLFIVRGNRVIEVKGNRFSVGSTDYEERVTFESHVMPLRENDMLYLFSDGYPDQFGGPHGKKYKHKRFRHFLQTISSYTLKEQKKYLEENINKWKGDLEQLDDVLVIGIRITKSLS